MNAGYELYFFASCVTVQVSGSSSRSALISAICSLFNQERFGYTLDRNLGGRSASEVGFAAGGLRWISWEPSSRVIRGVSVGIFQV